MDKNVLLISDSGGFMIDALANNIKKTADFDVIQVSPDIDEINAELEMSDIFLLFSGQFVQKDPDFLVFLKDVCAENHKMLCIIGYDHEIELVGKSIPDRYITRKFLRPFDMRKLADELAKTASPDVYAQTEEKKHLLLVDDDGSFLKILQTWLSPYYHVTIVNSGMQAITYIATHTPDLILLDYDMPITPGPQVLEMIRSEPASAVIPVIFLTGRSDKESVDNVMRLNPQGYLLKSMTMQEILDSVKHFFETNEWKPCIQTFNTP